MVQLTVNIPDDFLQNRDGEDFANEIKLAAAIYWYSRGDISMGRASELAGLSRSEFLEILNREKIDVFGVDFDDLQEEISSVKRPHCAR